MIATKERKVSRGPLAERVVQALQALKELRRAVKDGEIALAETWADRLSDQLLCLEDKVGCITPASLFDEE